MPAPISEDEIRRIYRETVSALYAYASRKCGGQRELAEDVTQEAWLRAVREWPRTGVPDKPLAWLITVARNLIINHFKRREAVSLDAVSPADAMAALESDATGESAEIASIVTRALALLPREEAHLLEAFHFERMKMSQIAAGQGISERAVEGRLRRARERLRRVLTDASSAEGNTV